MDCSNLKSQSELAAEGKETQTFIVTRKDGKLTASLDGVEVNDGPDGDGWRSYDVNVEGIGWRPHRNNLYIKDMYVTTNDLDAASDKAGGGGDPHMTNMNGEKFNIVQQGYAPLISITSEGMPHLEVLALVQGVKICQKK